MDEKTEEVGMKSIQRKITILGILTVMSFLTGCSKINNYVRKSIETNLENKINSC